MRARRAAREDSGALSLRLPYRSPLDADGLIAFLGLRAVPGVEEVARRRLPAQPAPAARQRASSSCAPPTATCRRATGSRTCAISPRRCSARARCSTSTPTRSSVHRGARRRAAARAARARRTGPARRRARRRPRARRARGARPAGLAARRARRSPARLVAAYGSRSSVRSERSRTCSPRPRRSPARTPTARDAARPPARAARARHGARARGARAGRRRGPRRGARRLLALPGIGPWTAEYIAMRALRDPDAFLPRRPRRAPRARAARPGRPAGGGRAARRALAPVPGLCRAAPVGVARSIRRERREPHDPAAMRERLAA